MASIKSPPTVPQPLTPPDQNEEVASQTQANGATTTSPAQTDDATSKSQFSNADTANIAASKLLNVSKPASDPLAILNKQIADLEKKVEDDHQAADLAKKDIDKAQHKVDTAPTIHWYNAWTDGFALKMEKNELKKATQTYESAQQKLADDQASLDAAKKKVQALADTLSGTTQSTATDTTSPDKTPSKT